MKKKLLLLLSVFLIGILLVGCGSSASNGEVDVVTSNSKGKLKVLTYANWNPFEYLDKGELVGFDIDLIKALAEEAGYECEIKNSGWDEMFTEITNNTADLGISGITITDSRKETYDFSNPYFVSRQSMIVKSDSDIKSGADLVNGKVIGVQNGSTGQEAAEKLLGDKNENIKQYKSGLQYMELINNNIDAAIGDDTSNKEFVKNNSDKDLVIIQDEETFEPEYFGLMFSKDSALKTEFDEALIKLYDNGTYTEIYKKWFNVEPDIDELKSAE